MKIKNNKKKQWEKEWYIIENEKEAQDGLLLLRKMLINSLFYIYP